jgi:hypothetical protein
MDWQARTISSRAAIFPGNSTLYFRPRRGIETMAMDTLISGLCVTLLWVIPVALLVARFYWPKRVSWLAIVLITAGSSWVLDSKVEELRVEKPFEEYKKCSAANAHRYWDGDGCERRFVDFFAAYPNRRWMPGIIFLLFFLPFYGVVRYAVDNMDKEGADDMADSD